MVLLQGGLFTLRSKPYKVTQEYNCTCLLPSWLQLFFFIQLNFIPKHIRLIPGNYSHHFPLLFSEGKKLKSHKTYA